MPKVAPFHSTNPYVSPKVYHNNGACTEGNNIEEKYKKAGTDNRPLCKHCASLNAQGK